MTSLIRNAIRFEAVLHVVLMYCSLVGRVCFRCCRQLMLLHHDPVVMLEECSPAVTLLLRDIAISLIIRMSVGLPLALLCRYVSISVDGVLVV